MAQHTEVKLIDDFIRHHEGEDVNADDTVEFGLDGKLYEIDLTKENAVNLREALADYVAAARISGRTVKTKNTPGVRNRTDREESQVIREWANTRGMKVAERGRIPGEIREAYHKAHGTA
jgi:hypothetical protein